MAEATRKTETHAGVRRYRERMRADGLRPLTLWVWDTRSAAFGEEARRQMARVAADPAEHEFAELWSRGQDLSGWTPQE